jgi:hypothetical protein
MNRAFSAPASIDQRARIRPVKVVAAVRIRSGSTAEPSSAEKFSSFPGSWKLDQLALSPQTIRMI